MAGRAVAVASFAQRLVDDGVLGDDAIRSARKRQKIYGGGLDTVLLELGLVNEQTLSAALAADSRLPPLPPALLNGPVIAPDTLFGAKAARRIGAVAFRVAPVYSANEPMPGQAPQRPITVQAIVRPGFDIAGLATAIGNSSADVFIVPEVRFEVLLGSFYAEDVPARFVSLLGRLMGPEKVRRSAGRSAPERATIAEPPINVGPSSRPRHKRKRVSEIPAARPRTPAPQVPPPLPRTSIPPLPRTPIPPLPAARQPVPTPSTGVTTGKAAIRPPVATPVPPAIAKPAIAPVEIAVDVDFDDRAPAQPAAGKKAAAKPAPSDLPALAALFFEVEGGPRAQGVESAIVAGFSVDQVFGALPELALQPGATPAANDKRVAAWLTVVAGYRAAAAQFLVAQLDGGRDSYWRRWAAQGLALVRSETAARENQIATRICACFAIESDGDVRKALLAALRSRLACPATKKLTETMHDRIATATPADAADAVAGVRLLRDATAVEALIGRLGSRDKGLGTAIRGALIDITSADPGAAAAGWKRWWKTNRDRHRIEWLLAGLAGRKAELRAIAIAELRGATGRYFGYHIDLPRHEREASRKRWHAWWNREGRAEFGG